MVKFFINSILLCVVSFLGNAQNEVLFSSGFEVEVANEWDALNSGGLPTFERNSVAKNNEDYGFQMVFDNLSQKGNLNTTKTINWENGEKYQISFYYKSVTPGEITSVIFKALKNDGSRLSQSTISLSSTVWKKHSIELIVEENASDGFVLFSIRPSTSGLGEVYFDDFLIEKVVDSSGFYEDLKTKNVASDESIVWQQFGPGMSGNNKSAHWHPTDPNTLFIGPNMGNSYRSTDKGLTYQTILNEDEAGYKTGLRGPEDTMSVDFSHQSPDYGFCTGERNKGIFQTFDKGKTWQRQLASQSVFDEAYLACVKVDPKDDNIWYVGAGQMRNMGQLSFSQAEPHGTYIDANSQAKIWKSIDKGETWVLKNNGLHANAEVESIIVDPISTNIIYVSTNYGFYKSIDSGETWIQKSNGLDHDVMRSLVMHHDKDTEAVTLFLLVNVEWQADGNSVKNLSGGVFKSVDNGETWTNINGNLSVDMNVLCSDFQVSKQYYRNIAHFFGITEEQANVTYPVIPSNILNRFNQIEVDPNDVNNIYLANEYSNASEINMKPGSLFRSKDGGNTWYVTFRIGSNWSTGDHISYWQNRGTPLGVNVTLQYLKDWIERATYDPKGCNFVRFNADGSVLHTQLAKISLMSYDGGDTWVDIDDQEVGTDTGVFVGAGNSNVPGHGLYQHLGVPNKVFCSAGENGLWITQEGGDAIREGAQAAKPIYVVPGKEQSVSCYAIHPTDTNIHYSMFSRQHGRGELFKSIDNGVSWESYAVAIEPWEKASNGDQAVHQLNLMIDKENPDNMYFNVPRLTKDLEFTGNTVTGFGVHKSTDGGLTWAETNNGLPASLDVTMIAFDPNDTQTLYATVQKTNGGLYKSIDGGVNWVEVTSASTIAGTYGINDIHFSNDGKVYITSGHRNATEGGLWVSNDGMLTWEMVFDFPWVNRIETAHWNPDVILLSTLANNTISTLNSGIYLSKNGGSSWIKVNKGSGQSDRVNDIAIDNYTPGKYYISTRGSGWSVAVDPNETQPPLSIKKVHIAEAINVYPNPVKDTFTIAGVDGKISLEIYSFGGNRVFNRKDTELRQFDISTLTSGLYVYKIFDFSSQKVRVGKFIKE
ncbi:T9SS type A sorting domain-containing protein [Polaribacter sp. Q13]|uniref:T9SS type A sorting domain-containing protein n=1 Tax=Polaribacter sp. Q13 TaxID=2806551 RepID=UPI00193B50AE|nr:T9SS type A sorting domain-containing protein [Polaribacter sp. Q13]QVY66077.1 T9SS type A sorting domain-containing protein [Polaribacter sp. Q13]